MVDWGDPETFWLNVTNALLGLVSLLALALVAGAVVVEYVQRVKERIAFRQGADLHTLNVPELGVTMADGGEEQDREERS